MTSQGKGYGPVAFLLGCAFWALAYGWYFLAALLAGGAL